MKEGNIVGSELGSIVGVTDGKIVGSKVGSMVGTLGSFVG